MNPKLEAYLHRIETKEIEAACISGMISTYYDRVIAKLDELDDDEDDYVPFPYSEELHQPVDERESGIGTALTRLLASGHNIDETDGNFNALMLAVGYGDAPMVHFLIQHGADAKAWPDFGEEPIIKDSNYYLDDIDIHLMGESFANDEEIEYMEDLYQTAIVLANEAHLGPYNGYCLKIDENGNVSV